MYDKPLSEYGELMTVQEFKDAVRCAAFTDYDGFGCPVKDGKVYSKFFVSPSRLHDIPEDATHIEWYNK